MEVWGSDENGNTISEQKKTYTTGKESSNMAISGRIGSSSIKLYQYDAFNRLVQYNDSASEAAYTYGADNLRASKTVNGVKTDFVWNGQNLAGETKNSITTAYTYDPTGIALYRTNGETTRYIKDAHGNVVATTRNNSIAGEYGYTAFGVQLNSTDTSNPFRYCGEYLDNESGLVYLRNRYYNSATGRFISEDPVKDGLNWYSYCAGNPVMSIDPSGLIHYIFTGIDQINHSNEYAKELKDKTGIDAKVILVDSADSFRKKWSSMGINSNIDNVIINLHGDTGNIYASNGESVDIGSLEKKEFDNLLLLSCDGGNLDVKNSNPASQFLKTQNIKQVIASDGNTLLLQDKYYNPVGFSSAYVGQSRSGEGYITYQYINDEIITTNSMGFQNNLGNLVPITDANVAIDIGVNIGKINRSLMYKVGQLKEVCDDEKSLINVLNSISR